MFFYASKILWMMATPLNALGLLFALGWLMRIWWKKAGTRLIVTASALFVVFGLFPIGPNLVTYLEKQYEKPQLLSRDIRGIIVLGGAFDSYLSEKRKESAANGNIDRLLTFVDLAKRYPRAQLVFSGGSGDIRQPERKESADAKAFFKTIGFPVQKILFEEKSRNTFENAKNTKALVKPKHKEKWIVVTSDYHLPRAVAVFHELGWGVVPYPSDPRTDGEYRILPDQIDVGRNFAALGIAIKEFIGTFIYYLTDKSALPIPQRTDIVFGLMDISKVKANELH